MYHSFMKLPRFMCTHLWNFVQSGKNWAFSFLLFEYWSLSQSIPEKFTSRPCCWCYFFNIKNVRNVNITFIFNNELMNNTWMGWVQSKTEITRRLDDRLFAIETSHKSKGSSVTIALSISYFHIQTGKSSVLVVNCPHLDVKSSFRRKRLAGHVKVES